MEQLNYNMSSYSQEYCTILKQMMMKMTSIQLSSSISYNFMIQIIPHHHAAILISCNLLKYTKNQTLQDIAFNIIRCQRKSIESMEKILSSCRNQINNIEHLYQYQNRMDTIIQIMFSKMSGEYSDNNIDVCFINEMISHHECAIAMTKATLEYNICSQLRPILESIIISQSKEIQMFKCLLKQV